MTDQTISPALPGEECKIAPRDSWSDLEKWVWHEIGSGRIADINTKLGKSADPKKPDEWGPERRISTCFLESILLHETWCRAVPRRGVRIVGAWFDEAVDLVKADIGCELQLAKSQFASDVHLHRIRMNSVLSLDGSVISGRLNMDSASIGGSLRMSEFAEFAEVILRGAKIKGQLAFVRAKVTGTLNLNSMSIGSHVLMRNADLANVDLVASDIKGQLDLAVATITGSISVSSTSTGGDLFMSKGRFGGPVSLAFVKIGGSLDLRGAMMTGLDLTGTRIDGDLHLASHARRPIWSDDANLILRNTRVTAVQDEPEAWPKRLDVHGFTYERFGRFGGGARVNIGSRGSKWFIEWLARDEPYTPQPYHQCAKVLREMGHPEMANDVLYAGRERDRRESWRSGNNPRATGLELLKWTIGYGYGHRYFRSLWWIGGFVLLGALVLFGSGEIQTTGGSLVTAAFFSLDLLLPIIQLHEPHYDVVLEGFAKYYFAFHKLMGYVLASFLIAGLSGLTK